MGNFWFRDISDFRRFWHFLFFISNTFFSTASVFLKFFMNLAPSVGWVLLNRIQDGHFQGCSRMGGWQKGSPYLKSVTHILQWWNLTVVPYLRKIQKNICITWHTSWVLLTSAFFHWKSAIFAISRNTDIDCILVHNFYFF